MSCSVVLTKVPANPVGALELERPFSIVPSHWIWTAAPESKVTLEAAVCFSQGNPQGRLIPQCWLAVFPASSEISPLFLKGDWSIWILFLAQWEATEEFSE